MFSKAMEHLWNSVGALLPGGAPGAVPAPQGSHWSLCSLLPVPPQPGRHQGHVPVEADPSNSAALNPGTILPPSLIPGVCRGGRVTKSSGLNCEQNFQEGSRLLCSPSKSSAHKLDFPSRIFASRAAPEGWNSGRLRCQWLSGMGWDGMGHPPLPPRLA